MRNDIRTTNSYHGLMGGEWNGIVLFTEQIRHRYVLVCRIREWRVKGGFRLVNQLGVEVVRAGLGQVIVEDVIRRDCCHFVTLS